MTINRADTCGLRAGNGQMKLRCRTCRIRKVKCDGSFPACNRCISTGRICDGFGIWGGGNAHIARLRASITGPPSGPPQSLDSIRLLNASERDTFDWYLSWTAVKLAGLFASSFWSTLVLQACYSEPAVLSAVLALGMAHRARPTLPPTPTKLCRSLPDHDERAFLLHYTSAIEQLREKHSPKRNKSSLHISLITCVLFACMELIRGHYKTGERLLRHGINLLQDRNAQLKDIGSDGEVEDDWIREALERLCVPAIQLGGPGLWKADEDTRKETKSGSPPTRIESLHDARYSAQSSPPLIFQSILQARETLDGLLHATLGVARHLQHEPTHLEVPAELLSTQRKLKAKLASWYMTFAASRVHITAQHGTVGNVTYLMLDRYYNMTYIMLETCARPWDQMAFDAYTSHFQSIVRTSIALYDSILVSEVLAGTAFAHRKDLATFVADRGWIMPLYYTATKCRDHSVRMQSILLLEKAYTREGVWDSKLAAAIAREIVKIEESGLYTASDLVDNLAFDSDPSDGKSNLPLLPEGRRIHESQIELPEDPWGKTLVHCRRRRHKGTEEVLTRVYDPTT